MRDDYRCTMGVGDVRAVRGQLGIAIAILFITPRSAWSGVRPIGADPQCWKLLCTAFWRYVAGRLEAVGVQEAEACGLFPCGEGGTIVVKAISQVSVSRACSSSDD